jgi:hypothetical protein
MLGLGPDRVRQSSVDATWAWPWKEAANDGEQRSARRAATAGEDYRALGRGGPCMVSRTVSLMVWAVARCDFFGPLGTVSGRRQPTEKSIGSGVGNHG